MKFVIALCLVLATVGCGTKYQEMGFTGGVSAQRMTANTFRISARGNAYTSSTTIQDYMVLKAAETPKQAGSTHFLIVSAADASRTDYITTPGQSQTSLYGNTAYTTYTPGTVNRLFKPGQDAYVRIITLKPDTKPPAGAISADEILQFVGTRVKRS